MTVYLFLPFPVLADNPAALQSDILALLQSGDYAQARSLSEKAYKENPSDPATMLLYAKTMRDALPALDLYKKIAADTLFPDTLRNEAFFRLGCAAYMKSAYQKAGRYLKKAAPALENQTAFAARCLNAVHDTADSSFSSRLSLQAADTSSFSGKMSCYFLALCSFAKKDYAVSLKHFYASVGASDSLPWACGAYAGAYYSALSLGRSEESASILAHLKRVYPQYLEKAQLSKAKPGAPAPVKNEPAAGPAPEESARKAVPAAKPLVRKAVFSLQVGAFGSADNAGALKAELGKRYSPVSVVAAIVGEKPIYRVRVGVFDAKESAQTFGDTALLKRGLKFRIVEDVPME